MNYRDISSRDDWEHILNTLLMENGIGMAYRPMAPYTSGVLTEDTISDHRQKELDYNNKRHATVMELLRIAFKDNSALSSKVMTMEAALELCIRELNELRSEVEDLRVNTEFK